MTTILVVGENAVGSIVTDQLSSLYPQSTIHHISITSVSDYYDSKPDILYYVDNSRPWLTTLDNILEDVRRVEQSFDHIRRIRANKTILFSSIEASMATLGINRHPYGVTRWRLEQLVLDNVPNSYVYQIPFLKDSNIDDTPYTLAHTKSLQQLPAYQAKHIISLNDKILHLSLQAVLRTDGTYEIVGKDVHHPNVGRWLAYNPSTHYLWLDSKDLVKNITNDSNVKMSNCLPVLIYSETDRGNFALFSVRDVVDTVRGKTDSYPYGHSKEWNKFHQRPDYQALLSAVPRLLLPSGRLNIKDFTHE